MKSKFYLSTTMTASLALSLVVLSGCSKGPEQGLKTSELPATPAPQGTAYASPEDLELRKARVDALAHFDDFKKAFDERKPGEEFAVKAGFKDGAQEVHKWLIVDRMENLDIVGHFANSDTKGNIQAGQEATAKATFIDDWSYRDKDGNEHGGYGLKILRQREKQQQQANAQ